MIYRSKILIAFLLFFIYFDSLKAQGLEYVKVEAESTGLSVKEAIDSALIQAIERVNGKSMESSTFLKSIESLEQKNQRF